ncbi:tRNA (guanine(9)-N1)-methyltransferase [Lachnellula hyalina]|uniref:tRNA (guanine(9)-N1)-methyltransferase n=1 Tax=Lachnellula hyalina TaxID=1316788 RepID=A0A8H8RAD7_9HELO|nr:tRNA (guanine(9)-N1)-methyltransferase [Lachnellula hyalina]TVY30919.1 tRNA (guanine(9)-N1)-methyltransferase [Lachnellula hyalina]
MGDIEERPSKMRKLNTPEVISANGDGSEVTDRDPAIAANVQQEHEPEPVEQLDEETNDSEKGNQIQPPGTTGLSKSQLKKLRKKQEWEAGKDWRKAKRREKHKEKQARKADARADLQAKIESGEVTIPETSAEKKKGPSRPIQVPVTLILDCDFDELMLEKEIISLSAQLTRCYSDNKCAPYRSFLTMSSWGGTLKTRFETVLTKNHLSWKGVRFMEQGFVAAAEEMDGIMRGPTGGRLVGALAPKVDKEASKSQENGAEAAPEPKPASSDPIQIMEEPSLEPDASEPNPLSTESIPVPPAEQPSLPPLSEELSSTPEVPVTKSKPQIVYLTSDSPDTLTTLSPNTSYIIGGIVDKNRHKGLCYKRACELGIPTAKLPIGEYMTMQSRSVLAINHVVEIMLKWLETGDWGEAFLSVIPKRKEARLKRKGGERDEDVMKRDESESGSAGEDGGVKLEEEEDLRAEYISATPQYYTILTNT